MAMRVLVTILNFAHPPVSGRLIVSRSHVWVCHRRESTFLISIATWAQRKAAVAAEEEEETGVLRLLGQLLISCPSLGVEVLNGIPWK